MASPTPTTTHSHHRVVVVAAGLLGAAAAIGALGMASGWMPLGAEYDARLPLRSPVLGAIALLLVIAVPSAIVARDAWRDDRRLASILVVFGWLIVTWIAVEVAFLQTIAGLHIAIALVGAAFVLAGTVRGLGER